MSLPSRVVALLAALAVLASACQVRFGVEVDVGRDGGGTLELTTAVDEELATLLADAGVDLRRDLDEVMAAAPEWTVEDVEGVEGVALRFRAPFDDPAGFADRVASLTAALDEQDGSLLRDAEIRADPDGVVHFSADAGVIPPDTAGAEGDGVTFDGDDLRALLDERGDELVRADLRVTLPAPPAEHDADAVDGRTVTWRLPVGEQRPVFARSEPPTDRTRWLAGGAFLLAAAVTAALVATVRRRRSRRG